jgi:hypothetical protein
MQQWYRQKLRELAEKRLLPLPAPDDVDEAAAPAILPLPSAVDRELAGRLTRLDLIDKEVLQALLEEARKRGHSLRHLLVDGEYLTAFQMEQIECGRLEGLALGPLRIIDRLRQTPLETVYRVFDPHRGEEALLRQLGPAASREQADEFRRRFRLAVAMEHRNLARTFELVERDGRPAALQEWTIGLPGSEWQEFAAIPSVWLELMWQAASGLQAAHAAGLDHGHLHAGRLLLTEQGDLKICGLGEPAWLMGMERPAAGLDAMAQDLLALGRIAASWLGRGAGRRLTQRGLEPLQEMAAKLCRGQFADASTLVEVLRQARGQGDDDGQGWPRLLALVRQRLRAEDVPRRQSA